MGLTWTTMKPLVLILISAYNAERWVADAIQPAIRQTRQRKEIIVADDGSTDRTADIVKQFGSKIKLVSTENGGLCAAVTGFGRQMATI